MIAINYLVKHKNELLSFYNDGGNVLMRNFSWAKNDWSVAETIFESAKNEFTINMSSDGLSLFCQDKSGNIWSCLYRNGEWKKKRIFESKSLHGRNLKNNYSESSYSAVKIYPLISKNKGEFSLLYNMPIDDENSYLLINKLSDSRWKVSPEIDRIYTNKFWVQNLDSDHVLVYYLTKNNSNEINLGYREITSLNRSDFHVIHASYYKIVDASFITTNDTIHTLYTTQNMFGRQLVYRRKESSSFSKPVVIFEGQYIDNNLILICENNLYIFWTVNNRLYLVVSENNGFTFSQPILYNESFSNMGKANYISDLPQKNFFCREVYVDKKEPFKIKLPQDVLKKFWQANFETANRNNIFNERNRQKANDFVRQDILINKLKNQLKIKDKQLATKDKQIFTLTNLLENKNQEIVSLCNKTKDKN